MKQNIVKLTFDGSMFSDGMALSWTLNHIPQLVSMDGDETYKKMSKAHYDAEMNASKPIVIQLDTSYSLPDQKVEVSAPVTVRKIVKVINKFYSNQISSTEYKSMQASDELSSWNKKEYPNWFTFRNKIKTYGDLKGDNNVFSGLVRKSVSFFDQLLDRPPLYIVRWSS